MIQLALLLLQVTRQILTYMQERRLINEGQRRQIEMEMARAARAAAISMEIRTKVSKLSDDEIDTALRGDYRD